MDISHPRDVGLYARLDCHSKCPMAKPKFSNCSDFPLIEMIMIKPNSGLRDGRVDPSHTAMP